MKGLKFTLIAALIAIGARSLLSQNGAPAGDKDAAELTEAGNAVVDGSSVPYLIRRLPVSSFPELPAQIADVLNQRGCTIPQTYEAHRPENVLHASLEKSGASDWAVLCSARGITSLLVFFDGAPQKPTVLASAPEKSRLQAQAAGKPFGFNWGIDPASPQSVHEAQVSVGHRSSLLDHDALADSVIDHRTIYHFYSNGRWTLLDMPD
jgi:hypothetical protein